MGGAFFKMADGSIAHVKGTGITACGCGMVAGFLCDYPMGRGKTCDAPLCGRHAISQGHARDNQLRLFDEPPDPETEIHFCPTHAAMAEKGRGRRDA
jgi:hypothetical protein